jgi:hypothetical protein
MTHVFGIVAATAVIVLCTLLPFLPGNYDSLAEGLSGMCRAFGFVGLLLVPIGALWVASGYWGGLAGKQYLIGIAALIVPSILWLFASFLAFVTGSLTLGVGMLVFWIYAVRRAWRALMRLKTAPPRPASAIAVYLLIVPVAVFLIQLAAVPRAIESSRNRAIRNSAQLIDAIEQYRAANGRYPESLFSLYPDQYKPGVIGIKEYLYEPNGDAYNVFFEQIALNFGTREIVMFNPRDRQTVTSHKVDRLELTPQQLALEHTRGHYAVHEAPYPHWKYFWFD